MNASAVTSDLSELVSSAADSFARAATPADLENAKALFLGKAGRPPSEGQAKDSAGVASRPRPTYNAPPIDA